MWGSPSDIGAVLGSASYDVVLDNNGKDIDAVKYVPHFSFGIQAKSLYKKGCRVSFGRIIRVRIALMLCVCFCCRPVADWAKANGAKQFLFISSAGIYKTSTEPPHVEGVCMQCSHLYTCFANQCLALLYIQKYLYVCMYVCMYIHTCLCIFVCVYVSQVVVYGLCMYIIWDMSCICIMCHVMSKCCMLICYKDYDSNE